MKVKMASILALLSCLGGVGLAQGEPPHPIDGAAVQHSLRLRIKTHPELAALQQSAGANNATTTPEEVRALVPNKPLVRDLAGGQVHAYEVRLDSGQYFHAAADQRGVDVVVSLFDPDGSKLAEIDSPSGTQGLEPVFWVAETEGTYRLEVSALDKNAPAGKYEIRMDELRPATEQDRLRVAAQKVYMEGASLSKNPTEGSLRMAKLRFQDALKMWLAAGDRERGIQTMNFIDAVYGSLTSVLIQKRLYSDAFNMSSERLEFVAAAFGPNSINVVYPMRTMASLLEARGQFAQAEALRKQELAIAEKDKGTESVEAATSLIGLARLNAIQTKYAAAEPLYKRALAIDEKAEGAEHQDVAGVLVDLGELYHLEKHYADAEQAYKRALGIYEKSKDEQNPRAPSVLLRLARNYQAQSRFAEAEEAATRAVAINEKALGPEHVAVATTLTDVAALYTSERKYADAEVRYQRALAIYDKAQGPEGPNSLQIAVALAGAYSFEGKEAEAEPLIGRVQTYLTKRPEALRWLRDNAARKDAFSFQYTLGALYEKGQGVKPDPAEAMKWYRMAAEQGDAQAYANLGRLHENGSGLPKDSVEAYKWYLLAGPGHQDWDAHKKELAAQLTKDQLAEAQKRATEWQKQHPAKP